MMEEEEGEMTKRIAITPAPEPLEAYAKHFDALLGKSNQREGFQAIRRHWQLVCCAFSFCWYHASHPSESTTQEARELSESAVPLQSSVPAEAVGTGEKNQRGKRRSTADVLAEGTTSGTRMAGALDHAATLLELLVITAPTSCIATSAHLA